MGAAARGGGGGEGGPLQLDSLTMGRAEFRAAPHAARQDGVPAHELSRRVRLRVRGELRGHNRARILREGLVRPALGAIACYARPRARRASRARAAAARALRARARRGWACGGCGRAWRAMAPRATRTSKSSRPAPLPRWAAAHEACAGGGARGLRGRRLKQYVHVLEEVLSRAARLGLAWPAPEAGLACARRRARGLGLGDQEALGARLEVRGEPARAVVAHDRRQRLCRARPPRRLSRRARAGAQRITGAAGGGGDGRARGAGGREDRAGRWQGLGECF